MAINIKALKAALCSPQQIATQVAAIPAETIEALESDDAIAVINAAILKACEEPEAPKDPSKVALLAACAVAVEVAKFHLDPTAPVTNRNRAGANGVGLSQAQQELEKCMRNAGVTDDLDPKMLCNTGRKVAYTKAKATPKPWHDAMAMLNMAVQARVTKYKLAEATKPAPAGAAA